MIRTSLVHKIFVCATKVAQDRHSPYADTPIFILMSVSLSRDIGLH